MRVTSRWQNPQMAATGREYRKTAGAAKYRDPNQLATHSRQAQTTETRTCGIPASQPVSPVFVFFFSFSSLFVALHFVDRRLAENSRLSARVRDSSASEMRSPAQFAGPDETTAATDGMAHCRHSAGEPDRAARSADSAPPRNFTPGERRALVAFLQSLNGRLIGGARTADPLT